MKVVFLQDVPRVGHAGDVKEVADGYARNFLLPRKLAEPATESALKNIQVKIEREARKRATEQAEREKIAQQLEGITLNFKKKVRGEKRLYGSIRDIHVAQAIKEQTGFVVDKGSIELPEAIQEVGEYEIYVKMGGELRPKIRVVVEAGNDK